MLIQTPEGNWINPAAVGAIAVNSDVVTFMSFSGEHFFDRAQKSHKQALSYAEIVAQDINASLVLKDDKKV